MANKVIDTDKLEQLLQKQWAEILDNVRLMRTLMENVRDTSFKKIKQREIPPRYTKISLSNFRVQAKNPADHHFEVWIEYSMPKENGIVIGTAIYKLYLTGDLILQNILGTHFEPES